MNQKTLDKRTYGRYIEKGLVKGSDVESHLKTLPDDVANATWVELDMDEAELSHSDTAAAEGLGNLETTGDGLDASAYASGSSDGEEGEEGA